MCNKKNENIHLEKLNWGRVDLVLDRGSNLAKEVGKDLEDNLIEGLREKSEWCSVDQSVAFGRH